MSSTETAMVVVPRDAISSVMLRLRHLANEVYYRHDTKSYAEAENIRDELAGWLSTGQEESK